MKSCCSPSIFKKSVLWLSGSRGYAVILSQDHLKALKKYTDQCSLVAHSHKELASRRQEIDKHPGPCLRGPTAQVPTEVQGSGKWKHRWEAREVRGREKGPHLKQKKKGGGGKRLICEELTCTFCYCFRWRLIRVPSPLLSSKRFSLKA